MESNSRRSALKAAIAGAALLPIAAAIESCSAKPESQTRPISSTPKNVRRRKNKSADLEMEQKKPSQRASGLRDKESQKSHNHLYNSGNNQQASAAPPPGAAASAVRSEMNSLPLRSLQASFTYSRQPFTFSQFRCDPLALESASLIAQCSNLRSQWESTFESAYAFLTDIDRFDRLDSIFKMQEQEGIYDLDSIASGAELQAMQEAHVPLLSATYAMEGIYQRFENAFEDQYGWAQLLGWLSHISAYGHSGDADATVKWNGNTDTVINYCYQAAVAQGDLQLGVQLQQLLAGFKTLQAQAAALEARLPAMKSKADWDIKNKHFRSLQVETMRDIYALRKRLVLTPSGPLNYSERLAVIQQSFDRSLSEALSRFEAIRTGFATIFGFDHPLPPDVAAAVNTQGAAAPSSKVFDSASLWLDEIASWYSRFRQTEQTVTLCLGLKDSVSKERWSRFLGSGQLSVEVLEDVFPEVRNVRCRAIALSTVGAKGAFSAQITLPADSYFTHYDGSRQRVSQRDLAVQRFGRVMPDDSLRGAERVGLASIYNRSPFGLWEISFSERSSTGTPLHQLKDVILEVIYVAQST